jgi:predicted SAM-dependent methyltransferase
MKPTCLVIGCGPKESIPNWLVEAFSVTRLDINPDVNPDIVADACKLPIEDESYDAIYSSHILEHIDHRLFEPLREWLRVLKIGGEILVAVPNLTYVAELILSGLEEQEIYKVHSLSITPMDMLYGLPSETMQHHWSFTKETLAARLSSYGYEKGKVYELRCLGPYDRCEVHAYAVKGLAATYPIIDERISPLWLNDATRLSWGGVN